MYDRHGGYQNRQRTVPSQFYGLLHFQSIARSINGHRVPEKFNVFTSFIFWEVFEKWGNLEQAQILGPCPCPFATPP